MLIAGTTGSGKSVCMNSIIISLLYKAGPEDVKLIMVDPKMVELANYNGIPHLMIPVVTDPKKAAGALQWAVTEMMRRYKTMSDAGVRDLESYNSIVEAEGGTKVPQLIVIIDELADLMMVAAKEVEDSICRIAQMGRASGVHLVIATQRPSADVITGLMKANIPSRIAFSVASAMESRIILDTQGAEKLVGKGDMLFAPIGAGKPHRVQGCFVTDAEVLAVTSYVKENFVADYDQTVLADIEKKAQQTGKKTAPPTAFDPEPTADELEGDELLPQAVDVVLETGQASVSMLQRRLKLGYARAARIVDEMEEKGIVGPFQGSKPRNILITKEQWEAMKSNGATQMTMDELEDSTVPEDLPF
jgi:S-DNA-T family DNA segregation ATPase FtsK/SpoIIIE